MKRRVRGYCKTEKRHNPRNTPAVFSVFLDCGHTIRQAAMPVMGGEMDCPNCVPTAKFNEQGIE